MPGSFAAAHLKQEPKPLFGGVDVFFEQARRTDIVVVVSQFVGLAHIFDRSLVVGHQLLQHIQRRDERFVVVFNPLKLGDVSNGPQCHASDLSNSLGELVDSREDLFRLFVQEQVIAAEMRTTDVPVEILGLHVDRQRICQERI